MALIFIPQLWLPDPLFPLETGPCAERTYLAERVGFEPTLPLSKHAFQACAFSLSAISPEAGAIEHKAISRATHFCMSGVSQIARYYGIWFCFVLKFSARLADFSSSEKMRADVNGIASLNSSKLSVPDSMDAPASATNSPQSWL